MPVRRGPLPPPLPPRLSFFSRDLSAQSRVRCIPETVTLDCCLGKALLLLCFILFFSFFILYPQFHVPVLFQHPLKYVLMYVLQPICHVLFFIYVLISFFFFNVMFLRNSHALVCKSSYVILTLLRGMMVVSCAVISAASHCVWGFFRYIPPKNS